ncbi:expression site-associated gene (ESAG) protein, putative [Trypanosoma brucei brucei TREU927]|uniref:Expression site-associated gene (ESAG) protein, putative n=1 Tax=Trypanosoma brucei brucei (strain 927/4 GUTat10.1) TaxID=185431 RepID=Q387A1_TRYB2|nr:expression site-associated gene (ESAG) protein, putative [Trypanosoma brucei brucei TREU927]EAN79130.1 expression site-associated gene (ESAG) protein, putative [Trypanosoma brucei brucei TREU927]
MLKGVREFYGDSRGRLYVMGLVLMLFFWWLGLRNVGSGETSVEGKKDGSYGNHIPRVFFLVAETRYAPGWCRMIVSSILTNVSVATVGMGGWYGHVSRWLWLYRYLRQKKMSEGDVIVIFDGGDTVFTGEDVREEAVKHFLDTTPKIPEAFNETAILRGEMTPPMLMAAENFCFTPQSHFMVKTPKSERAHQCSKLYNEAFVVSNRTGLRSILRANESGRSYLNGGGIIARVWALEEALKAFFNLRKKKFVWGCDQSMWALLLIWSITRPENIKPALLVRRGLISLDYETRYFLYPSKTMVMSGMILHFAGPVHVWKRTLPQYLSEINWYRALSNSSPKREASIRLLKNSTVEMYTFWGSRKDAKLSTVCPISNISDPSWLSGQLKK